jgi:type IV secretory pathway TrbD component
MIRKLVLHALPFLIPFAAYALYMIAVRRARKRNELFNDAPWYWLFVSGLLLCILSFIALWYFGTGE